MTTKSPGEVPGRFTTAYESIRRGIVEGRWRPGTRMIEQRIAEDLDLSRTPVREALRLLQAEGLVVVEPNRGAIVRRLDLGEVKNLYELRARLEAYAAERAATHITVAELQRLDEAVEAFNDAASVVDGDDVATLRAVQQWNTAIHGTILDASRHDRLASLLARTVDDPLVFQSFRRFRPDEMSRSASFHRYIRNAIAEADGPRAAALMAEHVLQGRDVLIAALGARVEDLFGDHASGEANGAVGAQ